MSRTAPEQGGKDLDDFNSIYALGETGKGAADPTVSTPSGLSPGFGYRLALVDWMRRAAEVLQMLEPGQDGDQEFQHFSLRARFQPLLAERDR